LTDALFFIVLGTRRGKERRKALMRSVDNAFGSYNYASKLCVLIYSMFPEECVKDEGVNE